MTKRSLFNLGSTAGVLFLAAVFTSAAEAKVVLQQDEARAVLSLFDKRSSGEPITEEDWGRLWSSEGYRRLEARQTSFGAKNYADSFREWVETAKLDNIDDLRVAVDGWESIDVRRAAGRALAYLPEDTELRATIYPVLKRRPNTFVFETETDPAIFMYVDPQASAGQIEDILTHELHHIGTAAACPEEEAEGQSEEVRAAVRWLGALAEGLAMLTVVGDPNVHPHAGSSGHEWLVWERDIARFNDDLPAIERFLKKIVAGKLSEEDQRKEFFALINTDEVPQGAFYTVGWKMGAIVERVRGREAVIESICDMRRLLVAYNEIVSEQPRSDGGSLATWDEDFLARLGAAELE